MAFAQIILLCLLMSLTALAQPGRFKNTGLTFQAGFEGGTEAGFGAGDRRLYTAPNYKLQSEALPGLYNPDVEIAKGAGRRGDALRFKRKNQHAIFYKAEKNIAFDEGNWTGTISFWLRLDPDKELEPGFCDPIQVTDKAYNDSAIWVDFTKDDTPRHFRLGVFGALAAWNPENLAPDKNPKFNSRLVVVEKPPFRADKWTHVAITYSALGSGKGSTRLYLDGKAAGDSPAIAEKLQWDLSKAAIRLGVNYVGLFDELSIHNRALGETEIRELSK